MESTSLVAQSNQDSHCAVVAPLPSKKRVQIVERVSIPPILRYMLEEANRPRSQREIEAEAKLALGIGSIAEVAAAKQAARRQLQQRRQER